MIINIKLSPISSASIRQTKKYSWYVAIFYHGKIVFRITKKKVLKFSKPIFLNYIIAPPLFIPPPVAELILDLIDGTIDLDYFYNMLKTMHFTLSTGK